MRYYLLILCLCMAGCISVGHSVTVNTLKTTDYVIVPAGSSITIPAGSVIKYKDAIGLVTKTKKWATTVTVVTQDDGVYLSNTLAKNIISQQ